ncbi:hypothetical protein VC885_05360 [Citrobacter freundii]|uniref:fimbrial protein n=1 Tax=Citrobacter freundii TaxID=546 RepID=UPI000A3C3412|nr:hypothetical protein [Citrobacter freundii]MBX8658979.1 hypothetical protein [Citrobacter freundii]MDE8815522.1 hypothetical protein [Citrobacter freundii]MDV2273469.1 hypothetical protein [Citrobacter freundii]MEB0853659.1 hypothetical protein [Citrobacter freundii]OUE55532.1 hypothetical protein AZ003_004476 [Citrobacter freundii]
MNKLIVLLLSGLAWINSARAADTLEYEFTGRVTESTCKVELYSYMGIPFSASALYVGAFVVDTLPAIGDITWVSNAGDYYFRISCPSGYKASAVTGKISTSQEVDAATLAIKSEDRNNQFGFVFKDTDQNMMIDFSTVENTQTLVQDGDVKRADFNFMVGVVPYGVNVNYGFLQASIMFTATFQ